MSEFDNSKISSLFICRFRLNWLETKQHDEFYEQVFYLTAQKLKVAKEWA
jgi:hypothetical protein